MEKMKNKKLFIIATIIIVLLGGFYYWHKHSVKKGSGAKAKTSQSMPKTGKSTPGKNSANGSAAQNATPSDSTTTTNTTPPQPSSSTGTPSPSTMAK